MKRYVTTMYRLNELQKCAQGWYVTTTYHLYTIDEKYCNIYVYEIFNLEFLVCWRRAWYVLWLRERLSTSLADVLRQHLEKIEKSLGETPFQHVMFRLLFELPSMWVFAIDSQNKVFQVLSLRIKILVSDIPLTLLPKKHSLWYSRRVFEKKTFLFIWLLVCFLVCFDCLNKYLFVCLLVCLFACSFVCLFFCLYVCLLVYWWMATTCFVKLHCTEELDFVLLASSSKFWTAEVFLA